VGERDMSQPAVLGAGLGSACFLDVETTGLSPRTDEVVELAMMLFEFDYSTGEIAGIVDSYCGLREPSVPIHPGATRVHGLTLDDLRGERLDDQRVQSILTNANLLIAHNARFDKPFVCRLFKQASQIPWACSCKDIRWRMYGYSSAKLQELIRAHNIRITQTHRAMDDVSDAIELLKRRSPAGRTFFAELLWAAQADGRIPPIRHQVMGCSEG
jgi:DNA polymerase-3 subunit epsilon